MRTHWNGAPFDSEAICRCGAVGAFSFGPGEFLCEVCCHCLNLEYWQGVPSAEARAMAEDIVAAGKIHVKGLH